MTRSITLTLMLLTSCAVQPAPSAAPTPARPVAHPSPLPDSAPAPSMAPSAAPFLFPMSLPGCTAAIQSDTKTRIKGIHDMARPVGGKPPDIPAVQTALDAIWASPCLAHVTRFFPNPSFRKVDEFYQSWHGGLHGFLAANIGGLYTRDGSRKLIAPPLPPPPLSSEMRSAIEPWICPQSQANCGHAATFVQRAHEAFDAYSYRAEMAWSNQPAPPCSATEPSSPERDDTSFERWARCMLAQMPTSYRYPDAAGGEPIRYRAAQRGWLVLRGRRGHYSFADELRAYDLSSGAAYVARSASDLVLNGPSVDFHAVDAKRIPEAFAGNVSADLVRELTFAMFTSSLPQPVQLQVRQMDLPDDLVAESSELPAGRRIDIPPQQWTTSQQTTIEVHLVDQGAVRAHTTFPYPHSANPGEQHGDELLDALEAGMEKGCPRARLPDRLGPVASPQIHPLDADPARQAKVDTLLKRAFDSLRLSACTQGRR